MKPYRFGFRLCLALIVLGVFSVAAQDQPQPLLTMLARVPDTPTSRSEIFFNDRRAIEAAYPPARMPADWAEFMALNEGDEADKELFPLAVWWRVFFNIGSSQMSQYFMLSEELPGVVGFDIFQVDQELSYGQPPEETLQLAGRFDLEAVRAAFSEAGFVQQDRAEVELWCGPQGCELGTQIDFEAVNPANPFGGKIGRKQPLIVTEDYLLSSPDFPVIENHLAVAEGKMGSLADAPEYRAAIQAVTAEGVLLQAYIWDGEILNRLSEIPRLPNLLTPEQRRQLFEMLLEGYETLPTYELLVFADTVTDTEQIARVALVYSDADAAKQASTILPNRIMNYTSLRVDRLFTELLQDRGVAEPQVDVLKNTDEGKTVVMITFATPKATPDQILALTPGNDNPPDVTAPGLVYNLLVQSAFSMDIGWLSTLPRETLEQLASG